MSNAVEIPEQLFFERCLIVRDLYYLRALSGVIGVLISTPVRYLGEAEAAFHGLVESD